MQTPYIEVRLYEMMGRRNIRTIKQMSEMSDVSQKAISKAVNNKLSRIDTETLAKLCTTLDCKISDLLVLRQE